MLLQYNAFQDTRRHNAILLSAFIADDYVLGKRNQVKTATIFYDTFDWRLFKKSLALSRTDDQWVVRGLPSGDALERLTTNRLRVLPRHPR